MSKFGERLIRSIKQAQAHARGEPANGRFTVISPDMTEEELTRLLEKKFGSGSEDEATETEQPVTNLTTQPGSASRPAQQRSVAAANRKS